MSVPRRVLCLPGSLRRVSSNRALLQAAVQLASPALELSVYEGMAALPLFNPDLEIDPLPATVAALRRAVGESDALLIACPEYAHGVPGPFKNLLDWLVGSLEFPDKPVVLWNASGRGSHHAQDALCEIVTTMSARLLPASSITVPLSGVGCTAESILADDGHCALLRNALALLAEDLRSH